jgi:tetratricopeptide (TPR) repeat protein
MRLRIAGRALPAPGSRALPAALAASALLAALLMGALAGCRTLPGDQITRSAGEQETAALDAFALRLLDLRLSPDAARLEALRAELDRSASRPGWSREAQARVDALRAEAALQAGDRPAARNLAEAAARLSDAEEGVWLVRAELEPDAARRLALLSEGLAKSEKKARLLCERGRELLKAGRYAEAAQDLDEGLRGLDPAYRALYGADRERALSLAQAAREAGSAAALGKPESLEGPLSLRGMVERAFRETRLLSSLSSNPAPSYEAVLPALQAAGLLLDPAAAPETTATRKAVAFFLWGLIARTEHDPRLLTRYRRKYSLSPVPDVGVEEPWFDAVLGVVERELMDLPDGVNFQPDQPVSGLEYLSILQRLQRLYR